MLWLGAPLLLYGWSLTGPYVFDDLNLVIKSEHFANGARDELGLFRFAPTAEDWRAMRSRGTYPWWSPESKRMDFFRPLAEWSFYLDVRLFERNPFWPRIESLVLFLLALIAVRGLYVSLSGDAVQAGVATFFLGISQCLTQPATFLSNRSDLFVILGLALAAMAYVRMRKRGNGLWWLVGIVGFLMALAAKESGVAFAGVLVLFEAWTRWKPTREGHAQAKKQSLIFVLVIVLLAAIYLVYYVITRGGNIGTASGGDASGQVLKIVQTSLLYLAVWMAGAPIVLLGTAPPFVPWIVAAVGGVFTSVFAVLFWKRLGQSASSRFFLLWALVMMSPALLAFPEGRALSVAAVGWTWLLATMLMSPTSSRVENVTKHWLLLVNGIVGIVIAVSTIVVMNDTERNALASMRERVEGVAAADISGGLFLIMEASTPFETLCAGDRLQWISGATDVRVAFLTLAGANATIERAGVRQWLIRGSTPELFDSPTHRLTLGSAYEATVGQRFELRDFTIEIAELNDAGQVTALRLILIDNLPFEDVYTWPREMLN